MFMMIIYITDFMVCVCFFLFVFFPSRNDMYIMRYIYVQFAFNGLMTELHCLFFVHIQEYVYDLCIMFLNEINKDY